MLSKIPISESCDRKDCLSDVLTVDIRIGSAAPLDQIQASLIEFDQRSRNRNENVQHFCLMMCEHMIACRARMDEHRQ